MRDPEFSELTTAYYDAWSMVGGAFDPSRVDRLYAVDADLIFFDVLPPVEGYSGWAAFRKAMVERVYASAEEVLLRGNDDLKVWRKGDIAITAQTFSGRIVSRTGDVTEFDGRNTNVWEQRDARWLLIHEHGSAPLRL